MGRPLPKKFFEQENLRIPVLADLGNGNVEAWLIGQERTGGYIATDGVDRSLVLLIDGLPSAPGQAQCVVDTVYGDKNVRQINRNHVKTFEGKTLQWVYANPANGQGAFKISDEKAKDQGADPFTIGLNAVFDRADPGLVVTDNEAQLSFTLEPGTYDALRIIFFTDGNPNSPVILSSAYNSGGTFYATLNSFSAESTEVMAKVREDEGEETPTLFISNTLNITRLDSPKDVPIFRIADGDQVNDNMYQTNSTTPDLVVSFTTNDGPEEGSIFNLITHADDIVPEPQDTVRYTKTLTADDITNGIIFKVTGTLAVGQHLVRTYYKNLDGSFSASSFNVIEVMAP